MINVLADWKESVIMIIGRDRSVPCACESRHLLAETHLHGGKGKPSGATNGDRVDGVKAVQVRHGMTRRVERGEETEKGEGDGIHGTRRRETKTGRYRHGTCSVW